MLSCGPDFPHISVPALNFPGNCDQLIHLSTAGILIGWVLRLRVNLSYGCLCMTAADELQIVNMITVVVMLSTRRQRATIGVSVVSVMEQRHLTDASTEN